MAPFRCSPCIGVYGIRRTGSLYALDFRQGKNVRAALTLLWPEQIRRRARRPQARRRRGGVLLTHTASIRSSIQYPAPITDTKLQLTPKLQTPAPGSPRHQAHRGRLERLCAHARESLVVRMLNFWCLIVSCRTTSKQHVHVPIATAATGRRAGGAAGARNAMHETGFFERACVRPGLIGLRR